MKIYKILTVILISALGALFITSCTSGSTKGMNDNNESVTTVLVYMIGADLETKDDSATKNIQQMLKLSNTSNLNIILQTGGSKKGTNTLGINWSHVQRYQVKNGQLVLLDDLGDDLGINMGSESTFTAFLQWGIKNYPANQYILDMWDHGGGPNAGIGPDEITRSVLSMPVILASIQASNTKYEIIGFDACLMSSVEIASGLQPFANYMVASQDLEPGNGWDYSVWLGYLQQNPTANGAQIGKAIADGFKLSNAEDVITLAVTDLSKVPNLVAAINTFSNVLQPYTSQSILSWEIIADARVRSLDFATSSFFRYAGNATDLVDLSQLVNNIELGIRKNFALNQALLDATNAVSNALESAIVYKVSTSSNDSATGLTMYFPSILARYPSKNYQSSLTFNGSLYFSSNYVMNLLPSYYDYYVTESSSLIATVTTNPIVDNILTGTITNDYNLVLVARGNGACTIYSGIDELQAPCIETMQNISNESHDADNRTWSFSYDTESNQWPTLQGQPVSLIPDFSVLKSLTTQGYLVPVAYKDDDTGAYVDGYLRVEAADESGATYEVKGFQLASDHPGKTFNVSAGDTVAISDYVQLKDGSWIYLRSNREIVFSSSTPLIKVETNDSKPGDKFSYVVDDLTGAIGVGQFQ